MLFSKRKGFTKIREVIQVESIDTELRNGLWDAIQIHYLDLYKEYSHEDLDLLIKQLWHLYFKKTLDTIPLSFDSIYKYLRDYYYKCEWYEVYDLIEFISSHYSFEPSRVYSRETKNSNFRKFCNVVLERENSGYRFVDEYITEITSDIEIDSIEEAMNFDRKYESVRIHLNTSLKLMSDKFNPDYRNSIKESISAVESLCKIISGDDKATLGKALKIIDKELQIHAALKGAFEKLYGYTSDSNGIRHAILEESKLTYQDALYMLVSCSAFINYLASKLKE